MSETKQISLIGLYNAIMQRQGFSFPRHMAAPAAALEDNRISKLIVILGPASSKSTLVDEIFPVYALGKDPTLSVLAISAGESLVNSFTRSAVEIIEHSPVYHAAFPHIRPNKALGWSNERGYFINRPNAGDPKPSLMSTGIDSRLLTGLHANIIIMDDLHDEESAFSELACKKVINTWYSTLSHRDVPQGSRFICIGRRWSEFDIYGHLMYSGDWVSMALPAERGEGVKNLWWDILVPESLQCVFTEGYAEQQPQTPEQKEKKLIPYRAYYGQDPEAKGFYWPDYPAIRQRCMEIKRGSPDLFQAIFQCNPGAREGSVFLEKDFRYFSHKSPYISLHNLPDFLRNARIIQSWDTSQKTTKDSDYSVCTTAAIVPCNQWHRGEHLELVGAADPHYDIYILDVYRNKLEINDLITKIRELHKLWRPSRILLEDKVSGISALQALQNASLPLLGVKPDNKSKRARATDTISNGSWSVQGWMRQGRILFWAEAQWLEQAKTELKNFTGDGSGYDDFVDSLIYLTSYVISMGTAAPMMPTNFDTTDIQKPTLSERAVYDERAIPLANFEAIISRADQIDIPQVCATCQHYSSGNCLLYKRRMAGIDSCVQWTRR